MAGSHKAHHRRAAVSRSAARKGIQAQATSRKVKGTARTAGTRQGDNARQASVPLFAENPSQTGIEGDERPSLFVRRLWLEVALPVGLLRLGRQASHGGLGLLFNDGNGFRNDFGDATGGTTFDRVVFATRPLTVINARPTVTTHAFWLRCTQAMAQAAGAEQRDLHQGGAHGLLA